MKLITAIALGLFIANASYGQNTAAPAKKSPVSMGRCVISGTVKNMRKQPVNGVEAFVYKADSSIIASGTTDMAGHFEANSVPPGDYSVKIVYPGDTAVIMVTGVSFKRPGMLEVNYKGEAPVTDTTLTYDALMPKAAPAPKGMAKKSK